MIKWFYLVTLLSTTLNVAATTIDLGSLHYDQRGLPLINLQIADQKHTLMLDTGSSEGLHLYADALAKLLANPKIKATPQATRRLMDITGNKNHVSAWIIHQLLINNIPFAKVEVVNFIAWGATTGNKLPTDEVLGLGLFRHRLLLIDLIHHRLQLLSHLPAHLARWSAYPIIQSTAGLRIKAYLGHTPLQLIIDTAASHSLLFADHLPTGLPLAGCRMIEPHANDSDCQTTTLSLIDKQGQQRDNVAIVAADITPNTLDFDGLLGINFMRNHLIILDMQRQMLYISH